MRAPFDLSVYVVLDPGMCAVRGLVETALAAAQGGATVVQLRDKHGDTAGRVAAGRAIMAALAGTGARFVMNDDVEAALALGAHGLHIGQDDGDPALTRARIGPAMALGLSVESVAAARAVDPAVVDHVGAGPVFATATKADHKAPLGFDGLAAVVAAAPVPAVAIGGLSAAHAAEALAAGARGLAVVSAVCAAPDPQAAARAIAAAVGRARA